MLDVPTDILWRLVRSQTLAIEKEAHALQIRTDLRTDRDHTKAATPVSKSNERQINVTRKLPL